MKRNKEYQRVIMQVDEKTMDYPENMPLPSKGDKLYLEGKCYNVLEINYHIMYFHTPQMWEVSIICKHFD